MTVCIKLFTEKMRIAQYADNTKPASFPIIMITFAAAVQQPGAYRLSGETKPILFSWIHIRLLTISQSVCPEVWTRKSCTYQP